MTTIRPLAVHDEADWRRLWRGCLAFHGTALTEAVYARSFARLLGNDPQEFHGLIAERDGRALGLAHFLFHRHGWRVENVCCLQDLWSEPEARGTGIGRALIGIGRALIEAVYARADAAGAPGMYRLTRASDAEARRLYDRVGRLTPFVKSERAR